MIILDTNVISELIRDEPADAVREWAISNSEDASFLCTPMVAELTCGAERFFIHTGSNRHQNTLIRILAGPYLNRILAFDETAARLAGRFRAVRENVGKPVHPIDGHSRDLQIQQRNACHTQCQRLGGA
jgi:toxin FitB